MAELLDKDANAALRERDVSRSFTLARASQTPFTTMVRKGGKPQNSLFEWPFKKRFEPEDSAVEDGLDVPDSAIANNSANKTMISGRVQKGWVPYGVGDIAQELIKEYGTPQGQLADNRADALVQAKENLEVTFLKDGDSIPDTGTGNPGKIRGMTNWIRSVNPGSPDLPVPTMALCPTGSIKSFASEADIVEDDFQDLMLSIATTCRKSGSWDVFVTPALKQRISNWMRTDDGLSATQVPLRQFGAKQSATKISLRVVVYESDFGMVRFHTHFFLPAGVFALVVDLDNCRSRMVRNPRHVALEYKGGSHKRFFDYIAALEVSNPQAHGKMIAS